VSTLRSNSITNEENILLTGILSYPAAFVFDIATEMRRTKSHGNIQL